MLEEHICFTLHKLLQSNNYGGLDMIARLKLLLWIYIASLLLLVFGVLAGLINLFEPRMFLTFLVSILSLFSFITIFQSIISIQDKLDDHNHQSILRSITSPSNSIRNLINENWTCRCGFKNQSFDSQCKSCGKLKN